MTKEEILKKSSIGKDVFVGSNSIRLIAFNDAIKAMDEYAKQEAIEFFKWFYEEFNQHYDGMPISGNTSLGGMTFFYKHEEYPISHAYELYIQSKNKT
tara:strand:- start:411 stop:704 length:294 start_codon:yes stop_codon:yes gene_type:complete